MQRPEALYEAVLYVPREEKTYITKPRTNFDWHVLMCHCGDEDRRVSLGDIRKGRGNELL